MRLGVSLNINPGATAPGADYINGFRLAEQAGFQSLWFFDTIGRGKFHPDPISAMAAAAAVTRHVELGSCILQVPLRHPVELAHRVLAAQYLSGNRILLGVGAGSTRGDFEAVEADYESRFGHLTKALPIMRALWRGETVREVSLTPRAEQQDGPPILIGSWAGSRWIPIAAKQYDGWIASAHFSSLATITEGLARYRDAGGTRAVATNIPVDLTAKSKPISDTDHLDLCCDPQEAAARLRHLAEIGFDDAVVTVTDFTAEHMAEVRGLFSKPV